MGHLYYYDGVNASSPGLFSNVISNGYWSSTVDGDDNSKARSFNFGDSHQWTQSKTWDYYYAWAVIDGDVAAPIWLFGSCIIGIVGIRRKLSSKSG